MPAQSCLLNSFRQFISLSIGKSDCIVFGRHNGRPVQVYRYSQSLHFISIAPPPFQSSLHIAPAIRVVDEQGNEIRDRYYKIGSTIDLTCQVATTFITKNASATPGSRFSLLGDRAPALAAPTTLFPPVINAFSMLENEIDVTERQTPQTISINSSLFERIRWTKDGESVTKDALFNRR